MYHTAHQLQKLRKEKGWTQAIAAREIGIQQSYLSKLENGKLLPSEDVYEKIAQAYGIDKATFKQANEHVIGNLGFLKLDFISFLSLSIATVLFLCGYLELFFSQRFYTYQFVLPKEVFNDVTQGFYVTQEYLGERFVHASEKVVYELVGERVVARKENHWLYLIAVLVLCVNVGRLITLKH